MASLLLVLLILTSVIAVADSHSDSRRQGTQQDEEKETSFSRPNWLKKFRAAGLEADTDKVGGFHNYEYVYGKYFAHDTFRSGHRTIRLLEIGLGCNMGYGPGHSVKLWQLWFPSLDLHEMEYDAACVQKWSAEIASMQNVTVHVGDQANFADLQKVLDGAGVRAGPTPWEAGENQFDVIIDDGGHYYEQIKNSFEVFFEKALKPGGLYVIEDVAPLRPPYPGRAYKLRITHKPLHTLTHITPHLHTLTQITPHLHTLTHITPRLLTLTHYPTHPSHTSHLTHHTSHTLPSPTPPILPHPTPPYPVPSPPPPPLYCIKIH
ncbi:hypothetical protein B484DRAFT_18127 [Ochromonadaceae sp. CCMP2298]|nr:hypothetical protein B484DRAFT_18127 [Ochromonadaceae sp. CCMP2298]